MKLTYLIDVKNRKDFKQTKTTTKSLNKDKIRHVTLKHVKQVDYRDKQYFQIFAPPSLLQEWQKNPKT